MVAQNQSVTPVAIDGLVHNKIDLRRLPGFESLAGRQCQSALTVVGCMVHMHWGPVFDCARKVVANVQLDAKSAIASRWCCTEPVAALDISQFHTSDVERATLAAACCTRLLILGANAAHSHRLP